jgi:DNA-binding NtrC family response regulator
MSAGRILVVDDEADIRCLLQEILIEEGYEVEVAADAREARSARARQRPDLVLLDIWMPDIDGISLLREWSSSAIEHCPVVMLSGHGTVETAVEATRLGAVDFIEKPLSLAKLLSTVERALETPRRQSSRHSAPGIVVPQGRSATMQQLRADLSRLAAHSAPLLLLAEPGSEPEALARHVHRLGARAAEPFIVVHGKLLDDKLALATLSGSAGQPGLLEQAAGGTLYLGDFEDLPDAAQRLLAGVIDSGGLQRNGTERVPFDARIIATAVPGVEARCGPGGCHGLYTQLATLPVRVPSLREYAEDVPELLRSYIDELTEAESLPFRRASVAAQNRLRNYPWPGNLRELRNLVRRLLLREGGEEISLQEVEAELASQVSGDGPLIKQDLLALPMREAREHFERAYLTQQLQLCDGRVGLLAKRVGMERTHLYRKLRALGVEIGQGAED